MGHPESIQFPVPGAWPFTLWGTKGVLNQTRVPEATGSAYLKEKRFCGAHRPCTWPPTSSAW